MASFVIEGGHRLSGDIWPQGAKNEALQIICATLLTGEEVTVHNLPDILDVNNLIQLMRDMGVLVEEMFLTQRFGDAGGSPSVTVWQSHHIKARGRQDRTPQAGHALHRHTKAWRLVQLQRRARIV